MGTVRRAPEDCAAGPRRDNRAGGLASDRSFQAPWTLHARTIGRRPAPLRSSGPSAGARPCGATQCAGVCQRGTARRCRSGLRGHERPPTPAVQRGLERMNINRYIGTHIYLLPRWANSRRFAVSGRATLAGRFQPAPWAGEAVARWRTTACYADCAAPSAQAVEPPGDRVGAGRWTSTTARTRANRPLARSAQN